MKSQRNSVAKFFGSRLFLLVFIPLALLVVFGFVRSYYNGYKINQEIAALQEEIASLENKKLESMQILDFVMSDSFVEQKARTELNMKKPGERVLVVQNQVTYQDPGVGEVTQARHKLSNPLKWWYYFTGNNQPET